MRVQTLLILVVALVFGLSAAILVSQFINRQPAPVAQEPEKVPLLVAARDIPPGEALTAEALELRDWPREMVPEGALLSVEEAIGRRGLVPLIAGEVVLDAKLVSQEMGRGLASMVPRGMRTWTIQTPHAAAAGAGFILPGDRVDVLSLEGPASQPPLVQNVEVRAIDQNLDVPSEPMLDPNEVRTVTLLVTPDQAMALARAKGNLQLSLRNPEDDSVVELPSVEVEPAEEPPVAAELPPALPVRKPPIRIKTVRGLRVGSYEFTTDWVHASPPQ